MWKNCHINVHWFTHDNSPEKPYHINAHVESHVEPCMCKFLKISCLVSIQVGICDLWKNIFTWWKQIVVWMQSSWNRVVKGIEALIFKGFGKIYDCVKYMVEEWCGITVTHRK